MSSPYRALDQRFDGYVDRGELAGYSVLIDRGGVVVHERHHGLRALGSGSAWDAATIVRIYSMTKPITSAAVMQLVERRRLSLDDRLDGFIPSFEQMDVRLAEDRTGPTTEAMNRPITIRHLLTHTSGLTYELFAPTGGDLAAVCEQWAELPLAFQPGSGWCYGVSTDVLGRVVELVSGQTLAEYFDQHLLGPLGLVDTAFSVPDSKADRAATIYTLDAGTAREVPETADRNPPQGRRYLSGGGGLWGTARDYVRWCRMMLNGGELDGARVLSEASVTAMTTNQLPDGRDIFSMCLREDAVEDLRDRGFGFGFAVELDGDADPASARPPMATYEWGGAASTVFWCDPRNDEAVVFVTQLIPDALPIRAELIELVGAVPR